MVKVLAALLMRFRVGLLEFVGASAVVVGAWQLSEPVGVIVAGVALLAKSMELDLRGES